MISKIIHNDIRQNWIISAAIVLFIAASAALLSLTSILTVNLSMTIDNLMENAKTPHFMQMHSGGLDTKGFRDFAADNGMIEDFQILEFLNVEGSSIFIGGVSLAKSVQDNGLIAQSKRFDFLMNLDGQVINPARGEIYVPLAYKKEGIARKGDKVEVAGKSFELAGFLRDSQMNSSLASSKRFLVNEADLEDLRDYGAIEYLIEFRLKDREMLAEFEKEYVSAGMDANGPTITYPLFKLINGISDGLMIVVILLISALLTIISLLCIRFSLLAKIEDDYREIGIMVAIGIKLRDIKKLYLTKYFVLAMAGSIAGFALSQALKGMMMSNIKLSFGENPYPSLESISGFPGIILILFLVTAYVNGIVRRLKKFSASEAIRFGSGGENIKSGKFITISRFPFFNLNILMGIKDVLSRKRLYATMLVVLSLSVFITVIPQNLYNTIASESFISYMGVGRCDLRLDVQQSDAIDDNTAFIASRLNEDNDVSRFTGLTTHSFQTKISEDVWMNLKIELGDHSVFPVSYTRGGIPSLDDEIALSAMNADELGLDSGDSLLLFIDGVEKVFRISGIYSDITNGGKTAKASFSPGSAPIMWSIFSLEFSDPEAIAGKALEYAEQFPFAKVSPIDEFVNQTFGSTLVAVRLASWGGLIIALAVSFLVSILFMKMITARDRNAIAILKANGFSRSDIVTQYLSRSLFLMITGMVLGTILANTAGQKLAASMISYFGAASFAFEINPLKSYFLLPMAIAIAVAGSTALGTKGIEEISIYENIKE